MHKTDYLTLIARGHAFYRMTNQGLDCAIVRDRMNTITQDEQWFSTWMEVAGQYQVLGQRKLSEGFCASAGTLLAKAALAYHFAQYLHFSNLEQKTQAQRAKVQSYDMALSLHRVAGRKVQVIFDGVSLPVIFRSPAPTCPLPVVVLVCGSDSSKEEHFTVESLFHERGIATVSFDGPGQGEVASSMPMRSDYYRAVLAVIDALQARDDIDPAMIGVVGFGFGGKLAVGAACAAGPRVAACVSVSGYYDMSIMDWSDPIRAWRFAHIVGAATIDDARREAAKFTLQGKLEALACPLLVLHGAADAGIPSSAARRIADEAGPQAQFIEVADGVHCLHNVSWMSHPLMADWVQARLLGVQAQGGN
ncbi:alpha/beta hydrolase [Xanthomonas axonopodis]|uniref:alpha/beta hydrolase family protein n=1 Tax=Xanthomonas axonopodis TaxID=53413 RepID=UPI003559041B